MKLSTAERRRYIDERLNTDWGWSDYKKPALHDNPKAYSYNDMLNHLRRVHGPENVPEHPMTIKRDVDWLRKKMDTPEPEERVAAKTLLEPGRFPEWRKKVRGPGYSTPFFQYGLFRVAYALTYKEPIPQKVIDYFDRLDPKNPFPENINDLIVNQEKLLSFVFLLAPRHGKTDLLQDFMLHTHMKDADKKIMFGNGTQQKSEQFIDNYLMAMMETDEWLNDMYGPFKGDDRSWSRRGYVLAQRTGYSKAMSMQPFGIAGNIRSFDTDLIIGDDLQSLQRARSETTTEGDYGWLTTELMTRREAHTPFLFVGSHVAVETGDLFSWIEQKKEEISVGDHVLIIKKVPAHDYTKCTPSDPEHKDCVIWPEKRPFGFLEAMRGLMEDDAMFNAVYNQIPQSKKMMHFPGSLMRSDYVQVDYDKGSGRTPPPPKDPEPGVLDSGRSFRNGVSCCGDDTILVFGFDPAASERSGASFSALIALAGCVKCGRRYVVDYWKDRQSPEVHPATLRQFVQAYPHVAMICIEINAYQRALSRDPRMVQLEGESKFIIKEWNTDERRHDPTLGIPASARHVKGGMLSIPYRTTGDQEFAETLLKEFIRWPQKPNDLVMAYWLADLALGDMIEDARYVDAEIMPGIDRWMTPWHETQIYEVDLSDITPDMEYS